MLRCTVATLCLIFPHSVVHLFAPIAHTNTSHIFCVTTCTRLFGWAEVCLCAFLCCFFFFLVFIRTNSTGKSRSCRNVCVLNPINVRENAVEGQHWNKKSNKKKLCAWRTLETIYTSSTRIWANASTDYESWRIEKWVRLWKICHREVGRIWWEERKMIPSIHEKVIKMRFSNRISVYIHFRL